MKKLGIFVNRLSNSEKNQTIAKNLNEICRQNSGVDSVLFFNDLGKTPWEHDFALIQSVEALDYTGTIVATDIITAYMLLGCIRSKKKYFYIEDTNWDKNIKNIETIKDLYVNDDIELIAKSEEDFQLIKRIFKEPKYIIEDFQYEQLKQLI